MDDDISAAPSSSPAERRRWQRDRFGKQPGRFSRFFARLKFWKSRENGSSRPTIEVSAEEEKARLVAEIETNAARSKEERNGSLCNRKKTSETSELKQLQLQQKLLQLHQCELLAEQRQQSCPEHGQVGGQPQPQVLQQPTRDSHLFASETGIQELASERDLQELCPQHRQLFLQSRRPVHLVLRGNPVIYHVQHSDVTRVGKVVRRRHRNYAYGSDHDFVRRDWERSLEAHAQAHAVKYNRSIVRGTSSSLQLRQARRKRTSCFTACFGGAKKPAKIRNQRLKIVKQFPLQPHFLSVYEIDKVSKHPSVAPNQRRSSQRNAKRKIYPPVHLHYQPMQSQSGYF